LLSGASDEHDEETASCTRKRTICTLVDRFFAVPVDYVWFPLWAWSGPVAVAVNADQNALRNAETLVPAFMQSLTAPPFQHSFFFIE
jgi:hypothetical protein